MMAATILVVDDNPTNLKLARVLLESEGYRVREAMDANAALERLRKERPDLVLMDVQLPGMDGLELTRQLRANPETRDLVIVAFTSYAMKGDEERAVAAGCDGYVSKPIDTKALLAMVARLLGES